MQGILSVLFIFIIFNLGYCVLSLVSGEKRESIFGILGLSLAAGSGCMGMLLFWLSLAGLRPTRSAVLSIAAVVAVLLFLLWKRRRLILPVRMSFGGRNDLWLLIPAAITVVAVAVVCIHALAFSVYEWDAFAIWGLKAKVLTIDSLRSDPEYFRDLSLSYSHLDYPLLLPFLTAGMYGMIGSIDDQAAKLIFPVLFMSLGCVVYWGLRWKASRIQSAFLTGVLMGTPTLVRWAGSGCADSVLALFFVAAACFALKWLEEQKISDLLMSLFFAIFCAHTKNEGMAMALNIFVVLCMFAITRIKRRELLGLFIFAFGVLVLLLPWLWWVRGIPQTHENYLVQINPRVIIDNAHRMAEIIPTFFREAIRWTQWGALWILIPLMSVLGFKAFKNRYVIAIWLLFVIHIGTYQFIYLISPWRVGQLAGFSLDRLLLHTMPLAVLIIGYHWSVLGSAKAAMDAGEPVPES